MTDPARPFRLIHTSDWHIGHELFGHDREAEHDAFLAWLVEQLVAEQANLLLVTGDVYDVANPPVTAMARLYRFLRDATERCPHLSIVIIGGNHDSAARINLPAALLGPGRVHLVGSLARCNGVVDLDRLLLPLPGEDGETAAWLAAVPYCRAGDVGPGGLAGLYGEVLAAGAARAGTLPLVVTGHLHVAGGDISEQSERRIVVGGEEAEAASLFDARAAYVALGHLHRAQAIRGETPIRYAGSPLPLSATERHYRHSVSVVNLAPGGAEVRELTIPRHAPFLAVPEGGARPLAEVEAAIAALSLDAEAERGCWPFVEISVLVDGPEPDLQSRVLAALEGLPLRLTRIVRVAARSAGQGTAPQGADLAELRPEAVFAAAFDRVHGGAPPDDLLRAFEQLLVETHAEEPR
ncbi:exonuclease SbcCD subunit D C-terminal domain-containing protein [Sphingomonas jatrophae]|uniref:Nuclease SbcCD subunit D n=1 Tax=Sphingomonas jatrophae TaxID=1166337 RepID=A0A1I6M2T2_9SPHN|nr:exonuclease SbcCD subunit D C-terminal domain-containing protein [Sphingomonas jatrophae]SFS09999.1 Exodeoxyribonuclease I subunit D [Sphingomonas jatrophae]